MIISPKIFEGLCLRFKAGDDAACIKEPMLDSATVPVPVPDAGEAPSAVVAPQEVDARDSSSKTEVQICISTGMS